MVICVSFPVKDGAEKVYAAANLTCPSHRVVEDWPTRQPKTKQWQSMLANGEPDKSEYRDNEQCFRTNLQVSLSSPRVSARKDHANDQKDKGDH